MINHKNILIFTKNLRELEESTAGHIYSAFLTELTELSNSKPYGPGYTSYDPSDTLDDILAKLSFEPECLFFSHVWLDDTEGRESLDPLPNLGLSKTKYPKVLMLNKEYVNLTNKLQYAKNNRFDLIFTHHHNAEQFESICGIPTIFLPLGYNHKKFNWSLSHDNLREKDIDLFYSGILQNSNPGVQSDIRRRILSKLFSTIGDIPIKQRSSSSHLKLFWNAQPRSRVENAVAKLLGRRKLMSIDDYVETQKRAKITLNALSPSGLISSRFMESMALGSLVLAEESTLYTNVFPAELIVNYRNDLVDLIDKIDYYCANEQARLITVQNAHKHVTTNHTWEKRAKTILEKIHQLICT